MDMRHEVCNSVFGVNPQPLSHSVRTHCYVCVCVCVRA